MVSIVQPFLRDTTMKHFTNAVNLSDTSVISPDLTKTRAKKPMARDPHPVRNLERHSALK
jgi:hypothetical protein